MDACQKIWYYVRHVVLLLLLLVCGFGSVGGRLFVEGFSASSGNQATAKLPTCQEGGFHTYEDRVCSICGEKQPSSNLGCSWDPLWEICSVDLGNCTDEHIVIPSVANDREVTHIRQNGFANCKYLKSITLPATLTFIDKTAFDGCENLEEVFFADPEGWYYTSDYNTYTEVWSEILAQPSVAAEFILELAAEGYHLSKNNEYSL